MKWNYLLSCTPATGSLVIFPELNTPKVSETRRAQIIPGAQVTYDASLVSRESFLIEKRRSMGFAMPIDGQTFTWDQYLEPVTKIVPVVGDLVGVSGENREESAELITCVHTPNASRFG